MGWLWVIACLAFSGVLPVKFSFSIDPESDGRKPQDCAAGSDRFYFLFTASRRSEVRVFDLNGRPAGSAALRSPAMRIWPACSHNGFLAARPLPNTGYAIEEYSADLEFVRTWTEPVSFSKMLCSGKEPVAIGSEKLPVWEEEPFILAPADKDTFVMIQAFSGTWWRTGFDGRAKTVRKMAGPGVAEIRDTRAEGEGLISWVTASDGSGVYVVLGRSLPGEGMRVQRYDFDGNFAGELRLPLLRMNRLFVVGNTFYAADFADRRVDALSIP